MLNSEDWTGALMVKSRQWRDPGKHRGPNYTPESLAAKLQATLNMIPAYTRYAAPSTALTLMNEKELRRTSDSLAVLVRIEKLSAQWEWIQVDVHLIAATDRDLTAAMADGTVPKCVGVSTFIFFIREVSVVGRWVIGLSSDELVSNSPGLYPSHDETFWWSDFDRQNRSV
jgi:hypothetical protein